MQVYRVGGAVRDTLLGRESQDHDYVVVGETPASMLARGYLPVGADFPVFLHPETRDEYALARTERKTAQGYHGFEVSLEGVTLEDDLMRRDLTINAMAMTEEGTLIDPYGGQRDLEAKVFRHVGPAFSEDPVRVLRILRFQARFGPDWTIAAETQHLMHEMVRHGELDSVTPERIWKEISRGLMEPYPERMVQGLVQFDIRRVPRFASYVQADAFSAEGLAAAVRVNAPLETRFALAFAMRKAPDMRHEIPKQVRHVATKGIKLKTLSPRDKQTWTAQETLALLEEADALKQGETFDLLVALLEAEGYPLARQLLRARQQLASLDVKAITAALPPGPAVAVAIRNARIAHLGHLA